MSRPIHDTYNIGFLAEGRSFPAIIIIPKFSDEPELAGAILEVSVAAD
jgi:hypothetical protein